MCPLEKLLLQILRGTSDAKIPVEGLRSVLVWLGFEERIPDPFACVFPMVRTEDEVAELLRKLPDDCSLEDIQYRLYVLEKVRRGLKIADAQGTVSHAEAEARLGKWVTE